MFVNYVEMNVAKNVIRKAGVLQGSRTVMKIGGARPALKNRSAGLIYQFGGCGGVLKLQIMSVCLYVCMHACMSVCLHVCQYVCMSVCMSSCLHVCMSVCLHVCMSVCPYVYVYNFIYATCVHIHVRT